MGTVVLIGVDDIVSVIRPVEHWEHWQNLLQSPLPLPDLRQIPFLSYVPHNRGILECGHLDDFELAAMSSNAVYAHCRIASST